MELFENYSRKIDKINKTMSKYKISSLEEAKKICDEKGVDPYNIAKETQKICFEDACWAYILGAAIAIALVSPQKVEVLANVKSNIIVVDAGHGAPDGGASANGITESDLNLVIAKKLESALIDNGFDVIMTREDADNIADADDQRSITEMKRSDLNNRVKIINESGADLCISIHLNKYDSPKYWGWQTFFNENSEEGKRLINYVREAFNDNDFENLTVSFNRSVTQQ